jgi:hypothetical protein
MRMGRDSSGSRRRLRGRVSGVAPYLTNDDDANLRRQTWQKGGKPQSALNPGKSWSFSSQAGRFPGGVFAGTCNFRVGSGVIGAEGQPAAPNLKRIPP